MPFAVIWLDLEIIILNEITHREKRIYDITYVEPKKKNDTNEVIYKTDYENLWLPKWKDGGKNGSLGLTYTHYYTLLVDSLQGFTV